MNQFIRISDPKAGPDEPRRLNLTPGRYLSEREFELLQAYVDDRITPLVTGLPPGIISGLELRCEGSGSNTFLHIQPGVAVGKGGNLIRLLYPLKQAWPGFAQLMERQQDSALRDGLYFLTLRSVVEEIDGQAAQQPCTRTEPDPTRERRLETVIRPGLQFISANPRLLGMPQSRAANRICKRFLDEPPHDASGTVPLALLKIINSNPEWIDTVAGRYLSGQDAPYHTLLAHTLAQLELWMEQKNKGDANTPLAALLGLDYLPAAAPLPAALLKDAAGRNPNEMLMFHPADLQVELAPVPASTVGGVIDRELPRGSIDLVHGLGDRIRLLLAIPDLDYRPALMDLPQRDTVLEDQLFGREEAATKAWSEWWQQWQLLFGGLTKAQCQLNSAPQYKLGLLAATESRPHDSGLYRDLLAIERIKALENDKLPTPEPYASHLLAPHPAPEAYKKTENPATPSGQLILQREALRTVVEEQKTALDESYRLLNEMNDYLNLQRQQLDSLTLSFSALAGGVPGDGSGSSMMRWNGEVAFDPTALTKTTGK